MRAYVRRARLWPGLGMGLAARPHSARRLDAAIYFEALWQHEQVCAACRMGRCVVAEDWRMFYKRADLEDR